MDSATSSSATVLRIGTVDWDGGQGYQILFPWLDDYGYGSQRGIVLLINDFGESLLYQCNGVITTPGGGYYHIPVTFGGGSGFRAGSIYSFTIIYPGVPGIVSYIHPFLTMGSNG